MLSEPNTLAEDPPASAGAHDSIFGYFLILCLAGGLGAPTGIAAIPIGYFLKDNLHLSAVNLALFVAITGLPGYVAFLPGFARDRFRPRAMGDRFYLLAGALVAIAAYPTSGPRHSITRGCSMPP